MPVHTHYVTLISVWTWAFHYSNKVHTTQHDFAGEKKKKNPCFFLQHTKSSASDQSNLFVLKRNQLFSSSVLGPEAEFNNYTC